MEGVLVEGESSLIKSDIVIFGNGFKGDDNIRNMFTSEYFSSIAIGSAPLQCHSTGQFCLHHYVCL
jgi:hypothetical protein